MANLVIHSGDRIRDAGHSISTALLTSYSWPMMPSGLFDQINVGFGRGTMALATATGNLATATGNPATARGQMINHVTGTSAGLVGAFVADIAAAVVTYCDPANHDVLIINLGVNDADHGTSSGAYQTSLTSIITQCLALNPSIRIACMSIFCNMEQWQASGGSEGGHWGVNTNDAGIATIDAAIQAVCTAQGIPYLDVRTPWGTWESTHNGSAPGVANGLLSNPGDGVHPAPAGQIQAGVWAMGNITLS